MDKEKMQSDELKNCPFCGGSRLTKSSRTSGHGDSTDYIKCDNCEARMEDYYGNPEKKWNTRPDHKELIERAEEWLKQYGASGEGGYLIEELTSALKEQS